MRPSQASPRAVSIGGKSITPGIVFAAVFCFVMSAPDNPAVAGEPAAIVEGISDPSSGVKQMEILEESRIISLTANATLTLGYLRSCIRETIVGGKVTVGRDKSRVDNGKVETETVDCDGGLSVKPSGQGAEVAGAVFRKGRKGRKKRPKPSWTVYSTEPLLRLSKPGEHLLIKRLDKDGEESRELALKGTVIDLSKAGVRLDPGGLYAMSIGPQKFIIKVSPLAVPEAPLLSRLIIM